MIHLLMFLLEPAHNRSLAPALTHEIYIPAGFPNPLRCQSFRWDEAGWVAPSWQLTPAPGLEKVWQKKWMVLDVQAGNVGKKQWVKL